MKMRSWIRNLFARPATRPIRKAPRRVRLAVEALEYRWCPSTFTVNSTADLGTGSGLVGDLRYCINQANHFGGTETIVFDSTVFNTAKTITLGGTQLELSDTTGTETITGPAAGVTVDGGGQSRVFQIDLLVTASVSGVTITGGNVGNFEYYPNGGGLLNYGWATLTNCTVSGNSGGGGGGGIYSRGSLTLNKCTVSGNVLKDPLGVGGGLFIHSGMATLTNCTVSGNSCGQEGGGLFAGGTTTLTNCTVSGNTANGGHGGGIFGGATLTNCTVSGNYADRGGGLYYPGTLGNTIVAGNTAALGPDVFHPFASLGNNLIGKTDGSSGWVASDLTGTVAAPLDAKLGALGNNGGPTQTMALLAGSPAIDAGSNSIAGLAIPTTDQRGALRGPAGVNAGSTVDIGAYEASSLFLVTSAVDSNEFGTLPTAVSWANVSTNNNPANISSPAANTVVFDTAGVFATPQTITLAGTQLTLTNTSVAETITSLVGVTVSGGGLSQVFHVNASVTASISGVTFTDGQGSSGFGGAGGVINHGMATLTNCTVSGNSGGGLYNTGTATLTNCTVSGNSGSAGGGVFNTGTATLTNCTVSGNSANGGDGGGVFNTGTATLTNCTVSGNSSGTGGGLCNNGTVTLGNTIVAGNTTATGPDAFGTFASQGHNLIGQTDGSSGWVASDLTGTIAAPLDAKLGLLGNNGGLTQTLALLAGSPALDAGSNSIAGLTIPTTDQRDALRGPAGLNAGSAFDIGAFEASSLALVTSIADSNDVGTLRAAVSWANGSTTNNNPANISSPAANAVVFDTAGVFATPQTITLAGAQLTLTNTSVAETITGTVAGVTVSGGGLSRVFQVDAAVTASLSELTISGGNVSGYNGANGNYGANGADGGSAAGAGIENAGSITLTNCTVSCNTASGGTGGASGSGYGLGLFATGGTGGSAAGAGIDNTGSVTLTNCTVSGNTANGGSGGSSGAGITFGNGGSAAGAGIENAGSITLTNCTVSCNTASGGSGFVPPVNTGSTTSTGGSAAGAGLDNASTGSVTFTNCTVSGNTASGGTSGYRGIGGSGAGAGIENAGSVTFTNCTVSGNTASGGTGPSYYGGNGGSAAGAGIDNASTGSVTFTNCTVSGNTASGGSAAIGYFGNGGSAAGAGIDNASTGSVTFTNCTVSGNTASGGAGGYYSSTGGSAAGAGIDNASTGSVTLTNCTVSGNTANGATGGSYSGTGGSTAAGIDNASTGSVALTNCTVSGNTANGATGGGYSVAGINTASAGTVTLTNTIVADAVAGTLSPSSSFNLLVGTNPVGGLSDGSNGNIIKSTAAALLLGPLGDYGGPTQTIALLPGSPAIDAGTSTGAPATDQRGLPRVGAVDIGAFEFQSTLTTTTTDVTTSVNPSTYGDSVTFTATVTSASTPTGSVNFVIDSGAPVAGIADGTTGTTTTWTFTTSTLSAGTHTVAAFYAGSGGFADSNGTLSGGQVVNKANVTITAKPESSMYGTTPSVDQTLYTVAGLVNNDQLATNPTLTLTGVDSTSHVGTYTGAITASGAAASSDYTISYVAGNWSVTTATVTITAKPQSSQYGTTPSVDQTLYTVAGLVNNDQLTTNPTLTLTGVTSASHVNTYTSAITASGAAASSDYTINYAAGNWSVTTATVTITAKPESSMYGTTPSVDQTRYTVAGLVNNDPLTTNPTLTLTGVDSTSHVNTYTGAITASGAAASSDYMISYAAGDWSVTMATLTITAKPQSSAYGTTPSVNQTLYTVAGLVNNDHLTTVPTLTLTGVTSTSHVGTYTSAITASGAAASSDYTISYVAGNWSVTTATVTITAKPQSSLYGTTPSVNQALYTVAGLVNNDQLTTNPTLTLTGVTSTSHVNTYTSAITASGAAASNDYTISYVAGNWSVTTANVTITAKPQSSVYGTTPSVNQTLYTVAGLVNNDQLTTNPTLTLTGVTSTSHVNTYTSAITASGAAASNDYTISYVAGNWSVTTANVTITAKPQSSVYGTTPSVNQTLYTVAGLVNNDQLTTNPTLTLSGVTSASHVNTYTSAITASGAAASSDYTISYVAGNWSVTTATVTITAKPQSSAYGTTPSVNQTLYTVAGLVNNDQLTTNPTLTLTGVTSTSHVATYAGAITASGAAASSDYTISYAAGDWLVTTATVTITAKPQSSQYGTTPSVNQTRYTVAGLVNNDQLTTNPTLTLTGVTSTSHVGTYAGAITASGAAASSDYTISYAAGDWLVTTATVTITAKPQSSQYGTTPSVNQTRYTVAGLVNNDQLTTNPTLTLTGVTSTSHVGTYTGAITASGAAASSDYTISYVAGNWSVTSFSFSISGSSFDDLTENGFSSDDPSLGAADKNYVSVTINLYQNGGATPFATATTDANGNYSFTGLGAGTYTVKEVVTAGWKQTANRGGATSGPSGTSSVTATNGGSSTGNDFDNFKYGQIGGTLFHDLTGDGFSADDPALTSTLQAVTVKLFKNGSASAFATATQNSAGAYSFSGLDYGTYSVQEVVPANWVQTASRGTAVTGTVTAASGLSATGNDFDDANIGAKGNPQGNGYWKNNGNSLITASDITTLNKLNLRDTNGNLVTFSTRTQVASFLSGANSKNPANALSAQLVAMELNVLHGGVSTSSVIYDPALAAYSSALNSTAVGGVGALYNGGFITIGALVNAVKNELGLYGNPSKTVTQNGILVYNFENELQNALISANSNQNFVI